MGWLTLKRCAGALYITQESIDGGTESPNATFIREWLKEVKAGNLSGCLPTLLAHLKGKPVWGINTRQQVINIICAPMNNTLLYSAYGALADEKFKLDVANNFLEHFKKTPFSKKSFKEFVEEAKMPDFEKKQFKILLDLLH